MNPILKKIVLNQGKYPKTRNYYNPSTWTEWTISANVVVALSGAEITATNGTLRFIYMPTTAKTNTKYGLLYNVSYSDLDGDFVIESWLTGASLFPSKSVGNQRLVFTTQSTITTNRLTFRTAVNNTTGKIIKLDSIRIVGLPIGSQIEADFTKLTGAQLNAKYPFNNINRR